MEDRQRTTTKSILDNYSGNVLDIPNGNEKILDFKTQNQRDLKDNSNQFRLPFFWFFYLPLLLIF